VRKKKLKKAVQDSKKRKRHRRSRKTKEPESERCSRSRSSSSGAVRSRRHRSSRKRTRTEKDSSPEAHRRGRLRSRSRDRSGNSDREPRERSPKEAELQAFRERYPMDSRAFLALSQAPSSVRRDALSQFKPRREGEDDYSALVSSFLRSLIARHERAGRPPPRQRRWRDTRESRDQDDAEDERGDSPLSAFRSRYPMDSRAFAALSRAPPNVRAVVLSDFKPRREGEDDYSALVMSFVRAVQSRVGIGRERSSEIGRDDDEHPGHKDD